MTEIIIYGLPTLIFVFFVVKRLIAKSYHRGWLDGFNDSLALREEIDKIDGKLMTGIRKDGDVD